ncbi:hypothetical protein J6590_086333 [Homalodisca vitripennis]|nr:hypothetical protein J6590_086333 [Homalodisca vitripennis]
MEKIPKIRKKLYFSDDSDSDSPLFNDDSDLDPDFIPGTPEKRTNFSFKIGQMGNKQANPRNILPSTDESEDVDDPTLEMEENTEEGGSVLDSSRVPFLSPAKSPRKRKRKSHATRIERNKKRRNEGREYITKSKGL